MSELENKSIKKQYLKCKLTVKKWENMFVAENKRLPTKADIKLSPALVRESYKNYYKIKTKLLASQILNEDLLKFDDIINESFNELNETIDVNEIKNDINNEKSNILDCKNSCAQEEEEEEEKEIDSKTWGLHLNKKKTKSKQKQEITAPISVLSQKLFKGSTFKKRNPRKTPSFSKIKPENQNSTNKNIERVENAASGLNQNSTVEENMMPAEPTVFEPNESSLTAKTSTNSTTLSSLSSSSLLSFSSSSLLSSSSITLVNKSAVFEERTSNAQKVSLVQEIASGSSFISKTVESVHEGWVERCIEAENKSELPKNSDSGIESVENSPPLSSLHINNSKEKNYKDEISDDDFISGSDNECKENVSSNTYHKKRKSDVLCLKESNETDISSASKTTPNSSHTIKKIKIDENILQNTTPKVKENANALVLERKMQMGTLNDNYVKINLEKKVYVRGKKTFNYSKYKKQQWKKEKKNLANSRESGGVIHCYKCGKIGHFGKKCKNDREDKLLEVDENENEDEDALPTLKEAEELVKEKAKQNNFMHKNIFVFEKPPEEVCKWPKVDAFYKLDEGGDIIQTPPEVYKTLEKFGHSKFRPGQEEAIMRILSGLSTLLIISTGGGKSLCYQLPAYLYAKKSNCITLVVSPLVSLMEDQVSRSNSFFKAGCLHTSQTQKQREAVLEDAKNGKLHALLVSPEAVVSGDSSKGFGAVFKQLPPIAFVCIDEVHCVSQWSHNFRPSYLMIHKVLKEKFEITTILGLTATATASTIANITSALEITSDKGVIKENPIPDNLCLSASRDENKEEALIQLLKSPKFNNFNAIIIYCTRRDECERLAVLIRTVLKNTTAPSVEGKSKRLSWNAESYHAGMAAARRKQVQKAFMSGNLRIVVATVAFGMGINKQDIRAVIHFDMPKDFESYVQELGRAGRDGLPAHCHLFIDPSRRDLNELRRHIYSNTTDRYVLRKLLEKVFNECDCKKENKKCEGHEIAFDCNETIQALDIPEENIHTLLCYLELHEKKFVKVLTPAYINCRIKSYKGISQINAAAMKCPPLAYVCALHSRSNKKKSSVIEFNVIQIANKIGWDSSLVKNQLKNLEWEISATSKSKRTGISVDFVDLGFRVLTRGDMTPSELDEALDYLINRVNNQEKRSNDLLSLTFNTLDHFACNNYTDVLDTYDENKSINLKKAIKHYFETEQVSDDIPLKNFQVENFDEESVAADVRTLISIYRDNTFNARAVARIFHGIQSPCYSAALWYKCRFWRKHIDKDFNKIIDIAKREILRLKL